MDFSDAANYPNLKLLEPIIQIQIGGTILLIPKLRKFLQVFFFLWIIEYYIFNYLVLQITSHKLIF